ncbi:MAG: twin-arginine translocation signal domain-containing protein, partial [Nitrososphaeraceae archaeon]
MSDKQDSLKDNQISRRGFLKLAGAGTFFLGLGAFGISNILNNIREASAQGANATNATGASAAPPSNNLDIRPFRVNVPEAELTELR